jgi:hypothetical protein
VIPVSASPRLRDLLRATPDQALRVLHRGRDAVYVEVAGSCVGVVGVRATAVPCALRSRFDDLCAPDGELPGAQAYLRDGEIHLDGRPVRIGRLVDVGVPSLPSTASSVAAPVPPAAVAGLVGPVPAAVTAADVARIIGRGDGLTPLGDDVLCGWLAIHRAAGIATPDVDAAVRANADRTTLLSATLLDCALRGEVLPEFAAYVLSLGTLDEPATAARLASVGHTSGAGLLHGARLALVHLDLSGVAA